MNYRDIMDYVEQENEYHRSVLNNKLGLFNHDQFNFIYNRLDDCRKFIGFRNAEHRRMNTRDGGNKKIIDWDQIKNKVKQSLMENQIYDDDKFHNWREATDFDDFC